MPGAVSCQDCERETGLESLREPGGSTTRSSQGPQKPLALWHLSCWGGPLPLWVLLQPCSQAVLWPWTRVDCVGRDSSFLREPLVVTKPLLLLPYPEGRTDDTSRHEQHHPDSGVGLGLEPRPEKPHGPLVSTPQFLAVPCPSSPWIAGGHRRGLGLSVATRPRAWMEGDVWVWR